jgi:predicted NACHT family NTPase
LPFIVEQFAICGFPDAELFIDFLLKTGRALLLFDGLDEVKQEQAQRRRLTRLLQDFARKYDRCQHLITCRIAASDYTFAGFADVEVADFTQTQVTEYARNWFGADEKKFAAFTDELDRPENRGLAELANTPLLLSLLCLTFDNAMRFPPNRAELYEDALDALLRKWDSSRQIQRDEIYRALSPKRKLHLLMNIAVPTFEKGELFFRQRDVEGWIIDYLARLPDAPPADTIDGGAILKAIEAQHGILVERAQGIYSFSHLTFQEYLTARYLVENQGRGVIDRLIANHLIDPRWREVLLLTSSLLEYAGDFVTALRAAAYGLLTAVPRTAHLLGWADARTRAALGPLERQYAAQTAYVFLDLGHYRDLDLASTLGRK